MKGKILIVFFLIVMMFLNHYDPFNVWLLNRLTVLRGILAPNCTWFRVSDLLMPKDGTGVHLYHKLKQKYGDFAPIQMFGLEVYIVTNTKYIETILRNSPDVFSVGDLKMTFFKSFMEKNVGVSTGCPWRKRRHLNEIALVTDRLHTYAEKYNRDLAEQLPSWVNKSEINYTDLSNLGKTMVGKIVFNRDPINHDVFKIFPEANTLEAFFNPDFKIDPKTFNNYANILHHAMAHPQPDSLIELCLTVTQDKEEIFHQIPHFIFPIVGLFVGAIPRLLTLLNNHPKVFEKVIHEINAIHPNTTVKSYEIYHLRYLRKCILETLRLNNPVTTTFRTLTKDYTFDHKYSFEKGTQFLILNNPVLREKEFFEKPNQFIPSRWTPQMENSFYAISFNQGPQRCPGKELAIYLVQSFIYNLVKIKHIGKKYAMVSTKINTKVIPQILNPCPMKFTFI